MSGLCYFAKGPGEVVEIEDRIAIREWPDGYRQAIAVRNLRLEHARIGAALAEHDATSAEVLPFPRQEDPQGGRGRRR